MEDYILYQEPRFGLFNISTDVYINGWVLKQEEFKIIGEDKVFYITEIKESIEYDSTLSNYGCKIHYAIGVNKQRFIKWINHQLNLF